MLITGYFLSRSSKRNLWKPIQLLVQVILFSLASYVVRLLLKKVTFSWWLLLAAIVPANWFCILYIALYLISPALNLVGERLTQKSFKLLLIVLLALFAIWATLVELAGAVTGSELLGLSTIGMYGSQFGYSIVQFVFMYLLGAYLRLYPVKTKTWILLVAFFVNVVLLTVWAVLEPSLGRTAWAYCNPLVVANSVMAFVLFFRIPLKSNKIISAVAGASFTVYLLHSALYDFFNISQVVNMNGAIVVLHLLGTCIAIYAICFAVHIVYSLITKPLYKWVEKVIKLPVLQLEQKQTEIEGELTLQEGNKETIVKE